jgi:hypothetical protein
MQQDDDQARDFDAKRHEQLTAAPKAVESDADPRIDVSEREDGVTRIDVADSAAVRPGKPTPTRDPR